MVVALATDVAMQRVVMAMALGQKFFKQDQLTTANRQIIESNSQNQLLPVSR